MQEDEQGFTNDIKTEIIEINYIPQYPQRHYQPQKIPNRPNPKTIANIHPINQSIFINQNLRKELTSKFIQNHSENIIYSSLIQNTQANDITFQSNFENGNLQFVVQKVSKQYHLFMRSDTNTKGHYQWFNFKIRNNKIKKITLIIKNFLKGAMLYRKGLKPYVKSSKSKCQYYRQITNAIFYGDQIDEQGNSRYFLRFQYQFEHFNDQVQFCSQPPYNHNRLESYVRELPFKKVQMSMTIMGNKQNAIVINENKRCKAIVVVLARQHPGQSVGSWMMEGFIEKLKQIKNSIEWIIIPMVNIDGVIMGNNRTGLLGHDFNRNWNADEETFKENLFPEVVGITKYLKKIKKQKGKYLKMMIDFHGHSSQQNVFTYGPPHGIVSEYYELSRLFPYLISRRNENFKIDQCHYEIEAQKKNCSRSIFFNKLGFPYSYTVESSFGVYNNKQINEVQMLQIGADICEQTINFINLITKSSYAEELKLKLNEVRAFGLKQFSPNIIQNSDSEDEDSSSPWRVQFFKKISSVLEDKEIYKSHLRSIHQKTSQNSQNKAQYPTKSERQSVLAFKLLNPTPFKINRMKTQPLIEDRIKLKRKKSQYFPPIYSNRTQRNQSAEAFQIQSKNMLGKKRIRQMSAGIFNMKTSKIGRKILILNSYKINELKS